MRTEAGQETAEDVLAMALEVLAFDVATEEEAAAADTTLALEVLCEADLGAEEATTLATVTAAVVVNVAVGACDFDNMAVEDCV